MYSISYRDTVPPESGIAIRWFGGSAEVFVLECLYSDARCAVTGLVVGGGLPALLLCRAMCSVLFADCHRHIVICTQLCSQVHTSAITTRIYLNISALSVSAGSWLICVI